MTEYHHGRGTQNRIGEGELIDVTDENQREHWSAEFGGRTDELERAVVQAYFENCANRTG